MGIIVLLLLAITAGAYASRAIFTNIKWSHWYHGLKRFLSVRSKGKKIVVDPVGTPDKLANEARIQHLRSVVDCHETAAVLMRLIHVDGAGAWPPRTNYSVDAWPPALRPYHEISTQMSRLLASAEASLDDEVNDERIKNFRARFETLLRQKIDMSQVEQVFETMACGRWDIVPRDVLNAFYCCIATSRHAYRWGTIPVVRVAQLEKEVELPAALVVPWVALQSHFGCTSDGGNNMSNIVLNFDSNGDHVYKINSGLKDPNILVSEEEFLRIFYDIEALGLSVYHDMVFAILTFVRDDKAACVQYMTNITQQLRPLLGSYYDRLHDHTVALSVWLSRVQGFFAWGAGHVDASTGKWVTSDGLSGNQALLFQALDAFLGMEPYLSPETAEQTVPARQREFCRVLRKYSFREKLNELKGESEECDTIITEFLNIVKRIRAFRATHRSRAKRYLSQPAPERLPMTTGQSVLVTELQQGLEYLDGLMQGRYLQTL